MTPIYRTIDGQEWVPRTALTDWLPIDQIGANRGPILAGVWHEDGKFEQAVVTKMTSMVDGDEAWIMASGWCEVEGVGQVAFKFQPHVFRELPAPPART